MDGSMIAPVLILGVTLFVRAVASYVEPPTDLVLHCGNMHNILEWRYGEHRPGLRFKILIDSYYTNKTDELWVDPPNLRANISFLSDVSDTYYITLTAVIGKDKSADSEQNEIMFSYYRDAPGAQKCLLDFPPVRVVSKGEDSLLVSFEHPALVYNIDLARHRSSDRKRRRSTDYESDEQLPEFTVDIKFINETRHKRFTCVESECEEEIQVDPAQKIHCLEFSGEMMTMKVQGKQFCTLPSDPPKDYTYVFIIVGSLLGVAVIALIFSMVYRKKTRASTPFPGSMTITQRLKLYTSPGVGPEQVFVPVVVPASPTPLLDGEEKDGKDVPPTVSPSTGELRLRIGVGEHEHDDVKVDGDEERGYMEGRNFEDEEPEVPSGYEKRPVFVEMGPDEQAEGYRN